MKPRQAYMLDTNMFSYIASGRSPAARQTMDRLLLHSAITVSTITEGEVLHGLARIPQALRLRAAVEELFSVVLILPWDSAAANAYATMRLHMSARGKSLAALDALIAAHAIATSAILVTRNAAFSQIEALHPPVNWATDL